MSIGRRTRVVTAVGRSSNGPRLAHRGTASGRRRPRRVVRPLAVDQRRDPQASPHLRRPAQRADHRTRDDGLVRREHRQPSRSRTAGPPVTSRRRTSRLRSPTPSPCGRTGTNCRTSTAPSRHAARRRNAPAVRVSLLVAPRADCAGRPVPARGGHEWLTSPTASFARPSRTRTSARARAAPSSKTSRRWRRSSIKSPKQRLAARKRSSSASMSSSLASR